MSVGEVSLGQGAWGEAGLVHEVLRRLLGVVDRLRDGGLEGGHHVGAVRRRAVEELGLGFRLGLGLGLGLGFGEGGGGGSGSEVSGRGDQR